MGHSGGSFTGRSVFAVALFRATLNLTFMLLPVNGSHFDMRLGGVTMAIVAAFVIGVWGPKKLTRQRPDITVRRLKNAGAQTAYGGEALQRALIF